MAIGHWKVRSLWLVALMATTAGSAYAQGQAGDRTLHELLTDTVTLGWVFGGAVGSYLFATVLTLATLNITHPPDAARIWSFVGAALWFLFVAFVVFGVVVPHHLPAWLIATLALVVAFFGVILLISRRL